MEQLRQVSQAMLMSDPVIEFNEQNRDKGSIPTTQEGLFDSGFLFEPSASQKTTRKALLDTAVFKFKKLRELNSPQAKVLQESGKEMVRKMAFEGALKTNAPKE